MKLKTGPISASAVHTILMYFIILFCRSVQNNVLCNAQYLPLDGS